MTDELEKNQKHISRIDIIQAVKTPIGFFVLVVLVIEAMFGALAFDAGTQNRSIIIIGMFLLVALLVIIVAWMAVYRPSALTLSRSHIVITSEKDTEEVLPDEETAYKRLRQIVKKAHRIYSTTISTTDLPLQTLHEAVKKQRDLYFEEKIRVLKDSKIDSWRELWITPEVSETNLAERFRISHGRYATRWIDNRMLNKDSSLPLISFTLVENSDGRLEMVAGWHKLIFSELERTGVYIHTSDHAITSLYLDYFNTLWKNAERL